MTSDSPTDLKSKTVRLCSAKSWAEAFKQALKVGDTSFSPGYKVSHVYVDQCVLPFWKSLLGMRPTWFAEIELEPLPQDDVFIGFKNLGEFPFKLDRVPMSTVPPAGFPVELSKAVAKAHAKQKTVYIAGPMRSLPNYGFDRFDAAAGDLRQRGYKVISPADIDREIGFDPSVGTLDDFDLPAAIRRDVDAILDCDAIVMLPGHENSKGATAERHIAIWAGIDVLVYPSLAPYGQESLAEFASAEH